MIAASTSIACGASTGCSLGVNCVFQKSGWLGFMIRVRSWSCALSIAACWMMTSSSLLATSACAATMSIGAIVPTSTRVWLFLSDWRDRSSDCLRDFEAGDRADECVVRGAHVARRLRDTLLQLDVGGLRLVAAEEQLLAERVDLEVPQQRLDVLAFRLEPSCGLNSWRDGVRRGARTVEGD